MKTIRTATWMAALAVAAGLTANAQGRQAPGGQEARRVPHGRSQRSSPPSG